MSKSKVYPPGRAQENKEKNFAKLSLNLKLMETVHTGRERIKIQNKQHISGFV